MQERPAGCVPGCNCFVNVPAENRVAVERFGIVQHVLGPGFNFAGPDLCGMCITFRSLTLTVEHNDCVVATKTQDGEFIQAKVAIEHSVIPELAKEAFCKLMQQDVRSQIESFVMSVVRPYLQKSSLEEAFARKDEISQAVHEQLSEYMHAYGFNIHKAFITELQASPEVMEAMNKMIKVKRDRKAAVEIAAADRRSKLKAAEAHVAAVSMQSEETARQAAAIIQGLNSSTGSREEKVQMFRALQHAQMLQHTDAQPVPTCDDPEVERLKHILQGDDPDECLKVSSVTGAGGLHAAPQQLMSEAA